MLSVGEIAKKVGISSKAVRLYESKGLLRSNCRGENNYRYFNESAIADLQRILELKRLGFTLAEISEVLAVEAAGFTEFLRIKLEQALNEKSQLGIRIDNISSLLSLHINGAKGPPPNAQQRENFVMEIRDFIKQSIGKKLGLSEAKSELLLQREDWLFDNQDKREFWQALARCIRFAEDNQLILGPGRGSAPSSMAILGLGAASHTRQVETLIPERLSLIAPDIHLDVAYVGGQKFVDFCDAESEKLSWGRITAFKMPLLDVFAQTEVLVEQKFDLGEIDLEGAEVLDVIRAGDIEHIFGLGFSERAMIGLIYPCIKEYIGKAKLKEYLREQNIESYRDLMNIFSLWRPDHVEKIKRLEQYKLAKAQGHRYEYLSAQLQEILQPNYGRIIYHEDIAKIIYHSSSLNWQEAIRLRSAYFKGEEGELSIRFTNEAGPAVAKLVKKEAPWTFCMAHASTFTQLSAQSAYLYSQHRQAYLQAIKDFEQQHPFAWDDIGVRCDGVSLLRH